MQWDLQRLCSAVMQVQSPSPAQWVKDLGLGHSGNSDLIPGGGTPHATGWHKRGESAGQVETSSNNLNPTFFLKTSLNVNLTIIYIFPCSLSITIPRASSLAAIWEWHEG